MLGQVLLSLLPDSEVHSNVQTHLNCALISEDDAPPVLLLVVLDPLQPLGNSLRGQEGFPSLVSLVESHRGGSFPDSVFRHLKNRSKVLPRLARIG